MEITNLVIKNNTKIIFIVIDGLGGLMNKKKTELEVANIPHLDNLAHSSEIGFLHNEEFCGLSLGSEVAHLLLFGYEPSSYTLGRGLVEALGIGYVPSDDEVVLRGNFGVIDDKGIVIDRRAKRLDTSINKKLIEEYLQDICIDGVKISVYTVAEHRVLVVLKGEGLSDRVEDTDPGQVGLCVRPASPKDISQEAKKTAEIINKFTEVTKKLLMNCPTNIILLRGASRRINITPFKEKYKLNALCIARYPMYKGIARLLGMDVADLPENSTISMQSDALVSHFLSGKDYDFFFLHIKQLDTAGEDGDFQRRVELLEEIDKTIIKKLKELAWDVLVVTGDHCTPPILKGHSWHPVPLLINSKYCRQEGEGGFSERSCKLGYLGFVDAKKLIWLVLAHAKRLKKYGI